MGADWQAVLDSVALASAGEGEPALVALQSQSVLEFTGADAESFLQGQFCNDLALVTNERAQLSGYCNPKGRLLGLFTLIKIDGGYQMIVRDELVASLHKRLQMFVMRDDVKITPRDDLLISGILASESQLAPITGQSLDAVMSTHQSEAGRWLRASDSQYFFIADQAAQSTLWGSGLSQSPESQWRFQLIQSGIPSLYLATVEQFVPQMVNLQQVDGLSFKKGCYPGQEIVARMQYLGKAKRKMLRFSVDGSSLPSAGDSVVASDDSDAGIVVDAASGASGIELLAVMKLSAVESSLSVDGQSLKQLPLPYAD